MENVMELAFFAIYTPKIIDTFMTNMLPELIDLANALIRRKHRIRRQRKIVAK